MFVSCLHGLVHMLLQQSGISRYWQKILLRRKSSSVCNETLHVCHACVINVVMHLRNHLLSAIAHCLLSLIFAPTNLARTTSNSSQATTLTTFNTLSHLSEGIIFIYVGLDSLDPAKWNVSPNEECLVGGWICSQVHSGCLIHRR